MPSEKFVRRKPHVILSQPDSPWATNLQDAGDRLYGTLYGMLGQGEWLPEENRFAQIGAVSRFFSAARWSFPEDHVRLSFLEGINNDLPLLIKESLKPKSEPCYSKLSFPIVIPEKFNDRASNMMRDRAIDLFSITLITFALYYRAKGFAANSIDKFGQLKDLSVEVRNRVIEIIR